MTRTFRLALAAGALVTLLIGASPVAAAGTGADFGACVAHHAKVMGGFSGWPGCADT